MLLTSTFSSVCASVYPSFCEWTEDFCRICFLYTTWLGCQKPARKSSQLFCRGCYK